VPVIQVGVVQSSSQVTCSGSAGAGDDLVHHRRRRPRQRRRAPGPTQRSTSTG
jgi:hypothetical protein